MFCSGWWEQAHFQPCVNDGYCSLIFLAFFFFNTDLGSLLKHFCWLVFRSYLIIQSYHFVKISSVLCIESLDTFSLWTLNSVASIHGVPWILISLSPSLSQPENSLKAVRFPSVRKYYPLSFDLLKTTVYVLIDDMILEIDNIDDIDMYIKIIQI